MCLGSQGVVLRLAALKLPIRRIALALEPFGRLERAIGFSGFSNLHYADDL